MPISACVKREGTGFEKLTLKREFAVAFASSAAFALHRRLFAVGSWEDGQLIDLS
jgi:hypothetical protein